MADAWQCDVCKKVFISGNPDYHDKRELGVADDNYDTCDDCSEKISNAILDVIKNIKKC